MNEQINMPSPEPTQDQKMKWGLFIGGFVGWYILNVLVWMMFGVRPSDHSNNEELLMIGNILVFPGNVLLLIILGLIRKTRMIGFGILTSIGLNLVISILLGVAFNGFCLIPFFID